MQKHCCRKPLAPVRLILFLVGCEVYGFATAADSPTQRHWQPARDEIYLQEVGRKVWSPSPLTSVAVYEGKVYAGSAGGLYELTGNELAEIAAVRSAIELAEQAGKTAGELAPLQERIHQDPNDHQARFDLAMAYYAAGDRNRAVDEFLELVRRNREWNEQAARKQLVKLFEAMGPTDELTVSARRRLSSILFS